MNFTTADLCDEFEALVKIAEPLFRDYGQLKSFYGEIATVKVSKIMCWSGKLWKPKAANESW